MNLEDLISKYVDGELTVEQDEALREDIAKNAVSREKFYSSVSLYLAMREDAQSLETPREVYQETEDRIMMEILKDTPAAVDTKPKRRIIPAFASLIVVFLLISIFRIDDMYYNKLDPFLAFNNAVQEGKAEIEFLVPEGKMQKDIKSVEAAAESNNTDTPLEPANDEFEGAILAFSSTDNRNILNDFDLGSFLSKENAGLTRIYNGEPSISALYDNFYSFSNLNNRGFDKGNLTDKKFGNRNSFASIVPKEVNTQNGSRTIEKLKNGKREKMMENSKQTGVMPMNGFGYSYNSNIHISPVFGLDMYHDGIETKDDTPMMHTSLGIAYDLSEKSKLGMELGYSEFTYNHLGNIYVPAPETPESGTSLSTVEVFDNENYIEIPWTFTREKRLYWGAVFYESTVFDITNFDLGYRVGFGGSNDGPLGFGRLTAKYEIISGINLTVGGDYRMFYANLMNEGNQGKELSSSLSIIYGLQFKF